jgi:hypothetical protein
MPFEVENGPPTYHRVMSKFFIDYLDKFMKIFLDDFTIYSDMELIYKKSNYALNVPLWYFQG